MKRSEFLRTGTKVACASCAALVLGRRAGADATPPASPTDLALQQAQSENAFINHWLTDLFAAIDVEADPAVQLRLMRACGRGCFHRHQFKQDLAEAGRGDPEKLIAAYRQYFGVEREGDRVHIRYGDHCFCPAAKNRPARPNDLHCECTRFTHETIFATALGRPIPVQIVESIRRGGKTCHLVADLGAPAGAPEPAAASLS